MGKRFKMKIRAGETFLYRKGGTESQVFEIRMKSESIGLQTLLQNKVTWTPVTSGLLLLDEAPFAVVAGGVVFSEGRCAVCYGCEHILTVGSRNCLRHDSVCAVCQLFYAP